MLHFEPFSIPALQKALPYIRKNPSLLSDLSAGYLFMWHEGADVQFCVWNDTFLVREIIGEQPAFSYPFGADPDGMVDELIRYASDKHLPLRFFAVNERTLAGICADRRLQPSMYAFDRKWSDYLYDFEEARNFRGRKYNGQRNHINRFRKLYGDPVIRFLTEEDRPAVEEMLAKYADAHPPVNLLEGLELKRTKALYDVCQTLHLYAAGLFVEEKLAALSIGEVTGDMLMIHVEKALTCYEGIYPTMYSGFVRLIGEHLEKPLKVVNREDDSGDPGIRTSKLQYHPVSIENKYLVHVNSPALRMPQAMTLQCGSVVLTELRERDKRAYMLLNTDVENNRYWGYDYREDLSITGPVDEETFFDSVTYDMHAGDSVNFAVRLADDGPMIGEAVLWNFTSDGIAEVGCRIAREHQGKGYGRAAFAALADFATCSLRLRIVARCYKENLPSCRMITTSGFSRCCSDDSYYYFSYHGEEKGCRTSRCHNVSD
ncbi:MAG: GNAT family N-acetyltransferase [Lachnospiraceae bacterium]|nr:GNAT family N-acetyltransferase [Lachnospiraceae bacterium]